MASEKETPAPQKNKHTSADDKTFDYALLTGHERTDGSYKSAQALRMEYIQLTDKLVYKMTDGLEVVNPETGEEEVRVPDAVIFLDKSARPLAWLTKELWKRLAADPETSEVPEMPDFKFLNIDREQWVNVVDPDGNGIMDIDRIDQSIIRSLRSIFVSPEHKDEKTGLTEAIDTTPTSLDGKTIMVVDEVRSSGRTLDIATQLIQRAFPDAYVGGTYWMEGVARRDDAVGNADLPVWYKKDDMYGRGVGDRHISGKSKNVTQKLGSWFLSTRLPRTDHDALQLREEFHHLATHPDVPIRPSNEREDIFERLESLNGQPTKEVLVSISKVLGKPLGKR